MRVIDENLLDEFRAAGVCEFCLARRRTFPHHILARGIGGGARLDVRLNLVALCNPCHDATHNGKPPTRKQLLAIVARREGYRDGEKVLQELWWLLRSPTCRPN